MAFRLMPDNAHLHRIGAGQLENIPLIVSRKFTVEHEATRYVQEVALKKWRSPLVERPRAEKPAPSSLVKYGEYLVDFLTQCERGRLDWRKLSPADVDRLYLDPMRTALLSKNVCESRSFRAHDFLTWAAARGHRRPFEDDPLESLADTAALKAPPRRQSQGGKRASPSEVNPPTEAEVARWLRSVGSRTAMTATTNLLMCKTILGTAIRMKEARCLRVSSLTPLGSPKPYDAALTIRISDGTKGSRPRNITIPRDLHSELLAYVEGPRKMALKRWRETHPGRSDPPELFLSAETGKPYTEAMVRGAWMRADLPFPQWTPHFARHWWAVRTLVKALRRQVNGARDLTAAQIHDQVHALILRQIQSQLGHVDQKTTELYCRWVSAELLGSSIHDDYQQHLDSPGGVL